MSDYFDRLNRETREHNSRVRDHSFSSSSSSAPRYGYFDPYSRGCGVYQPVITERDHERKSSRPFPGWG